MRLTVSELYCVNPFALSTIILLFEKKSKFLYTGTVFSLILVVVEYYLNVLSIGAVVRIARD